MFPHNSQLNWQHFKFKLKISTCWKISKLVFLPLKSWLLLLLLKWMIFRSGNNHPIRSRCIHSSIFFFKSNQFSKKSSHCPADWEDCENARKLNLPGGHWAAGGRLTHQDWQTARLGLLSLPAWNYFDQNCLTAPAFYLWWFLPWTEARSSLEGPGPVITDTRRPLASFDLLTAEQFSQHLWPHWRPIILR